jgi:hypothetical protein
MKLSTVNLQRHGAIGLLPRISASVKMIETGTLVRTAGKTKLIERAET